MKKSLWELGVFIVFGAGFLLSALALNAIGLSQYAAYPLAVVLGVLSAIGASFLLPRWG